MKVMVAERHRHVSRIGSKLIGIGYIVTVEDQRSERVWNDWGEGKVDFLCVRLRCSVTGMSRSADLYFFRCFPARSKEEEHFWSAPSAVTDDG